MPAPVQLNDGSRVVALRRFAQRTLASLQEIPSDVFVDGRRRCSSRIEGDAHRASRPRWISRPVKFADINSDDRPDILGALIHTDGQPPKDRASVFWLENNGGSPETWKAYPIKRSDGANTWSFSSAKDAADHESTNQSRTH